MSEPYEPREEDRAAWLARCAAQTDAQLVEECRRASVREALARVIGSWSLSEGEADDYWTEKRGERSAV